MKMVFKERRELFKNCSRNIHFSRPIKVAQVKPLFKNKNYQLDKTNYRSVSVLPAISKQKCHRNQLLFFIFNLFICLSTKVDVRGLNVKVSVFVACLLGWFSSITVFGFPIFLATLMKKSLKISDTFLGSFNQLLSINR
jgi:hypothetical protein